MQEHVGTIERRREAKGDRVLVEILKRKLPFFISEIIGVCPSGRRSMVLPVMPMAGMIALAGNGCSPKWISLADTQRITEKTE